MTAISMLRATSIRKKNNFVFFFTCESSDISVLDFFIFFLVLGQTFKSAPPPPPPPTPPPARLFKPRENQLEKEVDQQAKRDIPSTEQGRNPFRNIAKGKD